MSLTKASEQIVLTCPNGLLQLNSEQSKAWLGLTKFIDDITANYLFLFGYAGSGKTLLLSNFINQIDHQVAVLAFTRKAVGVIESYMNTALTEERQSMIKCSTMHSFFNIRCNIDLGTGKKVFGTSGTNAGLDDGLLLVIDECSMISVPLMETVQKYQRTHPSTKIIFMGDPKQLPPVGESISQVFAFSRECQYVYYLEEVMRTDKPVIVEACKIVRKATPEKINSATRKLVKLSKDGSSFVVRDGTRNEEEYVKWLKALEKRIHQGRIPTIIVWKNKTRQNYNNVIRRYLHKHRNPKDYLPGDILVFDGHYDRAIDTPSDPSVVTIPDPTTAEKSITFYPFCTSDMVKIVNHHCATLPIFTWKTIEQLVPEFDELRRKNELIAVLKELDQTEVFFNISGIDCHPMCLMGECVNYTDSGHLRIFAIHPANAKEYETRRKEITAIISAYYRRYRCSKTTRILWEQYYTNYVGIFAEIEYGYSITSHKSQGSTYYHVIADAQDILSNRSKKEAIQSLYTAVSRASSKLDVMI